MKKAIEFKILASLCTMTLLHAACSHDELDEPQGTGDLDPSKVYITVPDFAGESTTRTSFELNEDGVRFKWSENDVVGIVPDKGDQTRFEIVADEVGSNTAAFDGGAWLLRPNRKYYAYYPFSKTHFDSACSSEPIAAVLSKQKQKEAGQTSHLCAADYMAAAVTTPEEGALQFSFDHLCALVMIDVTVPVTTTYTAITLVAKNRSFVTNGQFVLTDENIAISPTETSDRITLELNDIEIEEGNKASFYMMVAPTDLRDNDALRVELTSSSGLKYATTVPSKNFEAGKAYSLNATFSGFDLTDFSFGNSVPSEIDRNSGVVTLKMPYGSDLSALVANFTVPEGAEVYVGEEKQTSGETANDFSMPVKYKVCHNGLENVYTVAIGHSDIPVLYINTTAPIEDKEIWVEGNTLTMANAGKNNAIYDSTIKSRAIRPRLLLR